MSAMLPPTNPQGRQIAAFAEGVTWAMHAAASVREAWAQREFLSLSKTHSRLAAEAAEGVWVGGGTSATDQAGYVSARLRGLAADAARIAEAVR